MAGLIKGAFMFLATHISTPSFYSSVSFLYIVAMFASQWEQNIPGTIVETSY